MSTPNGTSSGRETASGYRTTPVATTRMPPGIPYIIGNEAAERFSFYGMRGILVVFMTKHLMDASGQLHPMNDLQAREWFHLFVAAVYWFPLIGAVVADVLFGKYLTIMSLSIVYCLGHLALALNDTRIGLAIGLTLIAIGSGGIKPCVSANVGDQFGATNRHLLTRVYLWFYFAINVGSTIAMYWIPVLLKTRGPHVAFAVPGILMLIATIIFWFGRKKFVHLPPAGGELARNVYRREGLPAAIVKPVREYVRDVFGGDAWKALAGLLPIYAVLAVFWSLYDQCSSSWVQQAEHMDRHVFGHEWQAEQFQILNPIFVLIYVPLFSFVIYPALGRFFNLTPLRKMSIGLFFTFFSYLVPAWVQSRIGAGETPTIYWQFLAYAFLMVSEIMVYATGLEFSYTQAPQKMKSIIMAVFLATNTLGNLFTSAVNFCIEHSGLKLAGADYYLFFAALMFVAALAFIGIAMLYRGRNYVQDGPAPAA